MTTLAALRSRANLLRELADDERDEIRSRGLIPPHRDGSPQTVVEGRVVPTADPQRLANEYRAHCSCGYAGAWGDYVGARADARQHEHPRPRRGGAR